MAQSLNGYTVQPGGKWQTTSAEDKRRMLKLRKWADCVIVSRKTIMTDNANLYAHASREKKNPMPLIVMRNASEKISENLNVFSAPHQAGEFWIKKGNKKDENDFSFLPESEKSEKIKSKWKIYSFENSNDIINSLSERNYKNILLEGGGRLNGFFLLENLVDEIYLTMAPFIYGGVENNRIALFENSFSEKFRLRSAERRQNEIYLRYQKIFKSQ